MDEVDRLVVKKGQPREKGCRTTVRASVDRGGGRGGERGGGGGGR